MELLTYKQFPQPMRQIASNSWVREIMYRVNVGSVSDLMGILSSISGRATISESEKKSAFWYHVLKNRPVTWLAKINEIEKQFPGTKCVLNNSFWHFILYTKVKNISPEKSEEYCRYSGPQIEDEELMALTTQYINSQSDLSFSNVQLEQIYSINGLAALLAGNCQAKYHHKQNQAQYIACIYNVFLVTFSLRYHTDFVWPIYQLLKQHLAEDTSQKSLTYFDRINDKNSLIENINFIKNLAEQNLLKEGFEDTAKAKLIYVARHPNNLELPF